MQNHQQLNAIAVQRLVYTFMGNSLTVLYQNNWF
jgi:hypothetical protein